MMSVTAHPAAEAATTPKVVPPCVADALRGDVAVAGTPSTRWLKPVSFTSLGANAGTEQGHATDGSSIQNGGGLRTRVEVAHPA